MARVVQVQVEVLVQDTVVQSAEQVLEELLALKLDQETSTGSYFNLSTSRHSLRRPFSTSNDVAIWIVVVEVVTKLDGVQ